MRNSDGKESSETEGSTVDESRGNPTRRKLLQAGLGAAAIGLGSEVASAKAEDNSLFLPEENWRERMTPPDDGKRFGWIVDARRCFGCHGCEVACKSENDVPLGKFIRQTIYHDYEKKSGGVARVMVPMSCQHCEDAPCIKACPCGAMHKGPGGSVQVDYDSCSGHAACKEACPYGAIYIDPVANQAIKCHNCTHRVAEDMEPACVETCPAGALHFGDLNDPDSKVSILSAQLEREDVLATLRPEKGTSPRVKYAVNEDRPMSEWEPRIPREGQSYSAAAYSVYNWIGDDSEARSQKESR